ncbi:MAG: hypothetical protein ACYDEJ_16355 [Desulfitobacteriaceae bacterium]
MVILSVVFIIILIFFIAGIVGAANGGSREYSERGSEMIKTIYVYLVLFATLMMAIGGTVAAFMAVADLVSPQGYYQSFEQYKQMPKESPIKQEQNLSDAELKNRYDEMIAEEKLRNKERAINSLIKSFGWVVIPLPVFLYFQRRLKDQPVQ